jgi:hypothetical protein
MYVGLRVKYLLFLSDFHKTLIFSSDFHKTLIFSSDFHKTLIFSSDFHKTLIFSNDFHKTLIFSSDFHNTLLIFSTDFLKKKKPQISNLMKIRPLGVELFHADGQTDDEANRRFT